MDALSILIVDDQPEIVEILKHWLCRRGHRVHGLTDPALISDALRGDHYDVLLLDIVMPQANGLSLVSTVRSISPRTRTIVMSGLADEDIAVTAIREGADDVLSKPIDMDRLMQALDYIGSGTYR